MRPINQELAKWNLVEISAQIRIECQNPFPSKKFIQTLFKRYTPETYSINGELAALLYNAEKIGCLTISFKQPMEQVKREQGICAGFMSEINSITTCILLAE